MSSDFKKTSVDDYSIMTKRLQTRPPTSNADDMVELRQEGKQMRDEIMHSREMIQLEATEREEEFKDEEDVERNRKELYHLEIDNLRKDMKAVGARNTQQVMGEQEGLKKIHTREMSRLFKSKREIYQILLIEG
jgi:hypothetical protein